MSSDSGSDSTGSKRDGQPAGDRPHGEPREHESSGSAGADIAGGGADSDTDPGREPAPGHNEDLVSRLDALERELDSSSYAARDRDAQPAERAEQRPPVPRRLDRSLRAMGEESRQAYLGAWEAVLALVIGAVGGYYADTLLGSSPTGTIIGIAVGFAAMVMRLLRLRPPSDPPGPDR